MESLARQSGSTREKILDVASGIFAEKGYRGTTVAQICRLAKVNIASVNYHFGSKEALYQEAWRHAHALLINRFPPDGGIAPDAPAQQRLEGRIRATLQRALSEDAAEFRFMRNEMANPTGLLRQVIQDTIRPLRQSLHEILTQLLGNGADARTIELCEMSVIGPLLQIMRRQRVQSHDGLAPLFTEDRLEDMVKHFTTFTLAGIDGIRQRLVNQAPQPPSRSGGRPRSTPRKFS